MESHIARIAHEIPKERVGVDMVDVEPVGNCCHIYVRVWSLVPGQGASGRPEWRDVVCAVFVVCVIAMELFHVGNKPGYELDACECGVGAQGGIPA